jgi:hypothetical protein
LLVYVNDVEMTSAGAGLGMVALIRRYPEQGNSVDNTARSPAALE